MKEQFLSVFQTLGFNLEEMDGCGYGFRYEGINYLYMPNESDEEFLNIAIPAVLELEDVSSETFYRLMDKLNSTLKYVKANRVGDDMWLFYERELFGGEDLEQIVSRMILHLEAALIFLRRTMANGSGDADNGTPSEADDREEAA